MFKHLPRYNGDPILSVVEAFNQDPRADKINLSIGLYYDENGQVPILHSVAESIKQLATPPLKPLLYLPMGGYAPFNQAIQKLLLGEHHPIITQGKIATIQTVGSSSALKIGADFLKKYFPHSTVWVGNPTWENHLSLFQQAGFKIHQYPYFDPQTKAVDFEAILAAFQTIPSGAIILLQGCCHNPTGADLSQEQWDQLLMLISKRQFIPFIDLAYQGLGDGLEKDTYAIRKAISLNLPLFISHSCSKIFSLYGERCGTLSVICETQQETELVTGQLQAIARANYSTPPSHGALIVSRILNDAALNTLWRQELNKMQQRILKTRQQLFQCITQHVAAERVHYLLTQKGMFSYTGFTPHQVAKLRDQGIYLIQSGRLCLTGINDQNIERVATAMIKILNESPCN